MSALPTVLLVDDDAAIRRLVELALEEESLRLVSCPDAESALTRLQQAPVDLLITDLMMPGLTGFELLERLRDQPALRGAARLVAFSAGLNAERAERLQTLGVDDLLDKPVSIARLLDCVRRCLRPTRDSAPEAMLLPAGFGGDVGLHAAFLQACLAQYPQDLRDGDEALRRLDAAALRRLAHNLKGSLRTLGMDGLAELALRVEQLVASGPGFDPAVPDAWVGLRDALQRFVNKSAIASD